MAEQGKIIVTPYDGPHLVLSVDSFIYTRGLDGGSTIFETTPEAPGNGDFMGGVEVRESPEEIERKLRQQSGSGQTQQSEKTRVGSHLADLKIGSYRGIRGLRLDGLKRVNLITGPNGIGKTSVAEAVWLFNGRFYPQAPWAHVVQRWTRGFINPLAMLKDRNNGNEIDIQATEQGVERSWKARFDIAHEIRIDRPQTGDGRSEAHSEQAVRGYLTNEYTDGRTRKLTKLTVEIRADGTVRPTIGPVPAGHAGGIIQLPLHTVEVEKSTIDRFSRTLQEGSKPLLKENLQIILPLLDDVEIATDEMGQPFILATTATNERLPLEAIGGGMTRLFRLFVSWAEVKNGLLIVDEIEDGLHHKALPHLWRQVREMTEKFNVQLFATTHSKECIDAACETFSDRSDGIAIYALHHRDGNRRIDAAQYTGETLEAVYEMNLEVR